MPPLRIQTPSLKKTLLRKTISMEKRGFITLVLIGLSAFAACQPSQRIIEDSKRNAPPTPNPDAAANSEPRDDFQDRLKSVKTGNFTFVYSFRRKDGEPFTGEDKKYLKQNSPADTNQWILTADGKAAVAGSNYAFTPVNLENLKKRFEVADHSDIIPK